jgi:hypothetical protein
VEYNDWRAYSETLEVQRFGTWLLIVGVMALAPVLRVQFWPGSEAYLQLNMAMFLCFSGVYFLWRMNYLTNRAIVGRIYSLILVVGMIAAAWMASHAAVRVITSFMSIPGAILISLALCAGPYWAGFLGSLFLSAVVAFNYGYVAPYEMVCAKCMEFDGDFVPFGVVFTVSGIYLHLEYNMRETIKVCCFSFYYSVRKNSPLLPGDGEDVHGQRSDEGSFSGTDFARVQDAAQWDRWNGCSADGEKLAPEGRASGAFGNHQAVCLHFAITRKQCFDPK